MSNQLTNFHELSRTFKSRFDELSFTPLGYYISYGLKVGRNAVGFCATNFQNLESSK